MLHKRTVMVRPIARQWANGFVICPVPLYVKGFLAHKLRSLLTMMGIVFGIAAVIVMTAITEGGKQQQLQTIAQIGLTTLQVESTPLTGASLLEARRLNPRGLTIADSVAMQDHVPGLTAMYMQKEIQAEIRYQRSVLSGMQVFGLAGQWSEVTGIPVITGRMIDSFDDEGEARVAVIGFQLAQELMAEELDAKHDG